MGQSKDESQLPTVAGNIEDLTMAWTDENASAIEERRAWIEANGMPLADLQVLKLD
jgi:post-segregation antitoxin (ccd killing protein)